MNGSSSTMQITLEQVYEEVKHLRQDMDSKLAGVDDKFASMQAWIIGLMIGAAALTSAMGGVFIKMMMILVSR